METASDVLAIEADVYTRIETVDGPYVIGFRARVETPANQPAEITITPTPLSGAVRLDPDDPAYANALAFAEGLRQLAMQVRYWPLSRRARKSA